MFGNQEDTQVLVKFNADARKQYIEGLKKTYLGVLLSTELNAKTSKIKDVKTQVETLIGNHNENEIKDNITIGGKKVNVTLTKQNNNTYSVKFAEDNSQVDIKGTKDYTAEDLLTLCAQHELTIRKNKKGDNVFSVTIQGEKNTTIGGPGKISIFTQHLSYIKDTIEHLEKGGNPTKEFALATGTGKTYIELILEYIPARLMGTRYVSIAPDDSLVTQKRCDWKKYLSDADISDIELNEISDKKGCSILTTKGLIDDWDKFLKAIGLEQLPGVIEALSIGDTKFEIKNGKINIDGKDFVILTDRIQHGDKTYEIKEGKVKINNQEFELDITKPISLSFDEEHRVIEEELYKIRMQLLSTLCPTLFLSATPSTQIYNYVQEIDGLLKTLSLRDKMKSGAYGPLEFKIHQKQKGDLVDNYIEELEKAVTFNEKPEEGKLSFYHEQQTTLTGERLRKDIEKYIFYNIQSVIGESALILAETADLKSKLRKKATHNIFTDESNSGNHSSTVGQKRDAIIEHLNEVYGSNNSAIIREVVNSNLDYKSEIHDYSAFRVMHGVIENTLSCLTGLSRSELDEERFSDLEGLVNKVKTALNNTPNFREYFAEQSIKSDSTAREITQQMQSVINILQGKKDNDNDFFTRLVRNWNQDKKLHTLMPLNNVPTDKDYIFKLFGIKDYNKCTYKQQENLNYDDLFFDQVQSQNIFQSLKDTYEIDGNITEIEKGCNESYAKLTKAEQERKDYYNKHINPLIEEKSRKKSQIPSEYYYCNKEILPLYSHIKDALDESAKQRLASEISHVESKINHQENLPKYKEMKKAVEDAKSKLMTNFRRIKTEFSNREKYPLSALRLFSDENRYIEGNSQDHDAKLRMGLVGHCADEQYDPSKNIERKSRIQGFNAINLQHTVMLVDDKSNFINDPPQLIQGPGRLRCLNRARLSTLFCHSSGELKFDIELLQKGNYIDAYNKVMEENNKKSPEELGDEILKTIDKLIKDRVSGKIKNNQKFAEIDDLAAEIIEQVVSSFETVYNNKRHNAKETQDYFAKVLEYVTSSIESQLKRKGVVVGKRAINYKITDIKNKIKDVQSKIDTVMSKSELGSHDKKIEDAEQEYIDATHKLQKLKISIVEFTDKISLNNKHKEDISKKLEIKGNIIKRLFVTLYRVIRRLIFLRIDLEKQHIELEKKECNLMQDKRLSEYEEVKQNAEISCKQNQKQQLEEERERIVSRADSDSECRTLKKEKDALESKLSDQEELYEQLNREARFIGVMTKEENIEKKTIDPKVREDIINEQRAHNEKLFEEIKQKLQKIEKEDGASLEKLEELQTQIKDFESIKEKVKSLITVSSTPRHSDRSHYTTPIQNNAFGALKREMAEKNQPKDNKTEIEKVVENLRENIEGLTNTKSDDHTEEDNQVLLKEIKGDFEKLQTEKTRLEEVVKKKSDLETKKAKLEKILSYKENGVRYNGYYDSIVNKVLVYKSIIGNYDVAKVIWVGRIAEGLNKLMNNNYYHELGKLDYSYYTEHMSSCVKNPIFLELLSNVVMPLYNDGMLLKTFDTLCPGEHNQSKVEKICGLYDSLSNKDKLDLSNVNDVMTYTMQIGKVVGNAIQLYYTRQECEFFKSVANDNLPKPDLLSYAKAAYYSAQSEDNPALKNAQLVIKQLEKQEKLKVISDIHEGIFTPIKSSFDYSSTPTSARHCADNNPSKQEGVALCAEQIETELRDVKPLNTGAVISPDFKSFNSIQGRFSQDRISAQLKSVVSQKCSRDQLQPARA